MSNAETTPTSTTQGAPASSASTTAQGVPSGLDGSTFMDGAKNFIKNPLGIIGLFIVLVYAVAGVVTGVTMTDGITSEHPMTWFLVGFPLVIMWVFYVLVTKHHTKLYAPTDFLDPKDWLELQRLLNELDKKQEPALREAGIRTEAINAQQATLEKAKGIVDKAIARRMSTN